MKKLIVFTAFFFVFLANIKILAQDENQENSSSTVAAYVFTDNNCENCDKIISILEKIDFLKVKLFNYDENPAPLDKVCEKFDLDKDNKPVVIICNKLISIKEITKSDFEGKIKKIASNCQEDKIAKIIGKNNSTEKKAISKTIFTKEDFNNYPKNLENAASIKNIVNKRACEFKNDPDEIERIKSKMDTKYKYIFVGEGDIDSEVYLKAHNEDLLCKWKQGNNYLIWIFSNNEPDENFISLE